MSEAITNEAITNGVKVHVVSRFLAERSNPQINKFIFAYTVTITNTEAVTVQLMSRKWIIKDADGDIETVEGPGVVGEKPVLRFYLVGAPLHNIQNILGNRTSVRWRDFSILT